MIITEQTYKWNGSLTKRATTRYIVLHHRAGDGNVQSIHNTHLKNGWTGIGYHFYVRKDGGIYRGRPVDMVGAHTTNYNSISIGVCFEGNFENESMSATQIKAGQELISYLRSLYPNAEVKGHRDFNSTACPGKKFPFKDIKKGETAMTVTEAIKIIKDKTKIEDNTINFLLCYKYGEELIIKLAKAMK
jgi:N-acetyl-anhydromuramyl-L-alanine amidase AmpD